MTYHPTGIYVPLITPFTEDGELATEDLTRHAHQILDDGAAGIVALGTTGEPATLRPHEREQVIRICDDACQMYGADLIVGVGSNDTIGTAQALTELPTNTLARAALVVVPYYTRPSEAGVITHFEYLAARSPLPLILYNVPYRTGQSLGVESIRCLAEHPNITGIKQAVGSIDTETLQLLADVGDSISILAGEDSLVSPLFAAGAAGAILATANIFTREYVELARLWGAGGNSNDAARRLGRELLGPATELMAAPNPTLIKAALYAQGRIATPNVRLPLLTTREIPSGLAAALTKRTATS